MATTKKALEDMTLEEFKAAQSHEWGQYIAKAPINLDNVRAFNAGDPVPAGHVSSGIVAADLVEKVKPAAEKES